jgi:aryl-phospho-beta-D-glucosidase BglC (GH1 family)
LSIPNKLVYTGHFYGFSWPIPTWKTYSYEDFKLRLFNTQTYVRGLGFPYLLGEYGNNNQDTPWKYLMTFLRETDIDWTYWALDGFKNDQCTD